MTRPSFYSWLRQFIGDHSHAIGDLARDVISDPDWPLGPGSLDRYRAHLADRNACPEALDTLDDAWQLYIERTAGGTA